MKYPASRRSKAQDKIRLVHDQGGTGGPISTLSDDEQARVLGLADIALHAEKQLDPAKAGDRAHREHQRLKQELQKAVQRFEAKRRTGGR